MAGSWLGAVPVIVGLIAVLVVAGGAIGWALRWPVRDVVLAAPSFGVVVLLGCGVIVRVVGLPWTMLAALVGVALCTVAARLVSRQRVQSPTVEASARRWWGSVGAGLAVAGVGAATPYVLGVESPQQISTMADTSFHLAAARLLSDEGSGSLLDAGGVLWNTPYLYPGGFQALAASLVAWFGTDPVTASHAVLLVCAGVIFPAGVMLVTRWSGGGPAALAGSGAAAAAAFGAGPFFFEWYGPLWSNLLGLALVPLLLAVLLMLTRSSAPWRRQVPLALVAVATACGLAGAQPNALYGAVLLGAPLVVCTLLASDRSRRQARLLVAAVAVGCVGLLVGTVVASPAHMWRSGAPDVGTLGQALLSGLKLGDTPLLVMVPVLVLQAFGVRDGDRSTQRWAIWAWGAVVALWSAAAVVPADAMRYLTWPWWNVMARILAFGAIPGAVLVGIGCERLVERLHARGLRTTAATVAAVLVVALTIGASVPFRLAPLRYWYPHDPDQGWSGQGGVNQLRPLGHHIRADASVAIDPWLGGQYLYLVTGRRALFPQTLQVVRNPDSVIVGERVDRIATDPVVCQAARRLSVGYVITGGSNDDVPETEAVRYVGIARVPDTPGFVRIADSGPYTLWALPECRES